MLLGVAILPARSHTSPSGWVYEAECCDDRDCERVPRDLVKRTSEGWRFPNGEIVAFDDSRDSGDMDFHWCRPKTADAKIIRPARKKACAYAPPAHG